MRKILLIPSTFTGETKDPKIRIYKIAQIARAASTFGITDIGVYFDPDSKFDSHGLGRFIVKVLKYLNTPPYLRKVAFPIDESLKFIGVAPPLKVRHHLEKGRYRYAYVVKRKKNGAIVNDGDHEFFVRGEVRDRIVVVDLPRRRIIDKKELPFYFGYDVFYFSAGLKPLLERYRYQNFLLIGTSRYGDDIRSIKFSGIKDRKGVVVVFGSFSRGLKDILGDDWKEQFDYVINVVLGQEVQTIRTEEAAYYTLSILRYLNLL